MPLAILTKLRLAYGGSPLLYRLKVYLPVASAIWAEEPLLEVGTVVARTRLNGLRPSSLRPSQPKTK